jgi:hypothetical protein
MAIMWRPDLGIYNAFLFNYTSGFKGLEDSSGIIFPLPTLVSNSLQLTLLPWQKDVNDTLVTKAIDPIMCASAAASVAVLKWSAKGLPPVALPQVSGLWGFGVVSGVSGVGSHRQHQQQPTDDPHLPSRPRQHHSHYCTWG